MISLIAAVGFALFLASTYLYGTRNTARLQTVRDTYVPALELSNLNSARFERITELVRSAAVANEQDFINQAKASAELFHNDLKRLRTFSGVKITPETLEKLESSFNTYLAEAIKISGKIIETQGELDFSLYSDEIYQMNTAEMRTRALLHTVLEQSRSAFAGSVQEANESSRNGVRVGSFIGAMTVLLILWAGIHITNRVIATINAVNISLRNMSEGEGILTNELKRPSNDEIGDLVESVNYLSYQLRILATTDLLTGMKNFAYFQEELDRRIHEYRRSSGENSLSIVLFDLDHFKRFNDTYGHLHGNTALKHTAAIMKEIARRPDICCRYGGEEFVVILPMCDLKGAFAYAERVRQKVSETPVMLDGQGVLLSTSAGCACLKDDEELADFVHRADQALYEAKERGRNKVIKSE